MQQNSKIAKIAVIIMDDIAIQMALLESLRDSLASIRLAAILCNGCDLYAASPSLVREISEFVSRSETLTINPIHDNSDIHKLS